MNVNSSFCVCLFRVIFASSVLNLAELLALRPGLCCAKKIIYFHENQLVYPVQKQQDRDFQYGYNQILSCMTADKVLFNSQYNLEQFLNGINGFLKLMPDYRPKHLPDKISPKCSVLSFPMTYPETSDVFPKSEDVLYIVWPHRWEHDKNPEKFFRVIFELNALGLEFRISVLGEGYQDVPEIFNKAKESLPDHKILHWGFQQSKSEYFRILSESHVALSTADHEFFGVAMLEATYCGCYPLCPRQLVYPEIFPDECLYRTEGQLIKRLKEFCLDPKKSTKLRAQLDLNLDRHSWTSLKSNYMSLFSLNQ